MLTFNTNDGRRTNSVAGSGPKFCLKTVIGVVHVRSWLLIWSISYLEVKPRIIWSRSEAQNITRWERDRRIHWHWCSHWCVVCNCKSCCEVAAMLRQLPPDALHTCSMLMQSCVVFMYSPAPTLSSPPPQIPARWNVIMCPLPLNFSDGMMTCSPWSM